MPSNWKRISPAIPQPGQIQAVLAKKHVTIFRRSDSAPGAGRPEVKAGFTACGHETLGEPDRLERNVKMKACMERKGLKTGIIRRKSRARAGSPLFGHVYQTGPGMAGA